MLSPQFYSQITSCPSCKGWGTDSVPPKKGSNSCKECGGLGIFLAQSEQTFIWGIPNFIDYKKRVIINILRIAIIIAFLLLIFIAYYFVSKIQIPRLEFPIK